MIAHSIPTSPRPYFQRSSTRKQPAQYRKAGVIRVWIINSRANQITLFYPHPPPEIKKGDDEMSDILLPDLTLTPGQIFAKAGLS